jgi:carboxypeptidase C (cathepsin A)
MPKRLPILLLASALLACASVAGYAQQRAQPGQGQAAAQGDNDRQRQAENEARKLPAEQTSRHTVEIAGKSLAFTATVGAIPLFDGEGGALIAEIGFIAYRQDGADPANRPVAFLVNGGPGAASGFLNIGGLGPWRLPLDPISPSAPPTLVPNAETWLPFTDLVFIDPVGTGFSWTTLRGEDARRRFWSVDSDISGLAVAMRKWLDKEGRRVSPILLVGESYGGFRVPKLARSLQNDQGVGVRGLVMLSPVLDFGWRFQNRHTPLHFVAELPSMAAAAIEASGKPATRAALSAVERYAATEFLTDLMRGPRDKEAVGRMADRIAGFTGLDPALVRRLGGRVDPSVFVRERGRASEKIGSLYDATIEGYDPNPSAFLSRAEDPVLDGIDAPITAAMTDLYKRLGWRLDRQYRLLSREVGGQWQWGGRRASPEAVDDLRGALALDPRLRAVIAHGATDLVTPYFESQLLIDQLPTFGDPDRLRLAVHPGGHMFYLRGDSRAAFRDDGEKLVREVTGGPALR